MLKNITLSAEDELIKKARVKAKREHTTLNTEFREWLKRYVSTDKRTAEFAGLMESLSYANAGRSYTRDEMNER